MKYLVDVVNFNGDASCMSSKRWLEILQGGYTSSLVKWLFLYVDLKKKVVLGFPGAIIADISTYNPEAISLINDHPEIFEIIIRPFAHDIALLRIGSGFLQNIEFGCKTIYKEFKNVSEYFLPPEFMLTNKQVSVLQGMKIKGIFINSSRFSEEIMKRIPTEPYKIRGLFNTTLNCIPIRGDFTMNYLCSIAMFDVRKWNDSIQSSNAETIFTWRDGESSFFFDSGLEREGNWLEYETEIVRRKHVNEVKLTFTPNKSLEDSLYRSYPVHSFLAWMKEFRMMGYVNRVQAVEERLELFSDEQVYLWLMTINSDILSSVEKASPIIQTVEKPGSNSVENIVIKRVERGFEGEEYLAILYESLKGNDVSKYTKNQVETHLRKLEGRIRYLRTLEHDLINISEFKDEITRDV